MCRPVRYGIRIRLWAAEMRKKKCYKPQTRMGANIPTNQDKRLGETIDLIEGGGRGGPFKAWAWVRMIFLQLNNIYWNIQIIFRHITTSCIENFPVFTLQVVLRIHDILGWIQIRGSMPLTNGSGSGTCYFRHWPSRCQQKTNFLTQFFLLITFRRYIYIIFQR